MSLLSEYQSRYSTQRRVEISNPQLSSATTVDSARETLASTDVQAAFKMRGITFDTTIDTHVSVGVAGMEARLLKITGQPGGSDAWSDWMTDELKLLAETTSRDRISPTTDSLLSPTQDTLGDLPVSDRKNFKDYVTDAPTGGTTLD